MTLWNVCHIDSNKNQNKKKKKKKNNNKAQL